MARAHGMVYRQGKATPEAQAAVSMNTGLESVCLPFGVGTCVMKSFAATCPRAATGCWGPRAWCAGRLLVGGLSGRGTGDCPYLHVEC